MGFWIAMLFANLFMPLMMLGIGVLFARNAPKEINYLFGYRTSMSMKNQETWTFAHLHCGRVWRIAGAVMIPLSVIAMVVCLLTAGTGEGAVGIYSSVIMGVQTAVLIGSIFPTTVALHKTFNKDGTRK